VRLKAAEERERQAAADKAAAVQDLQEQVRDLMVFLEARQAIEAAGAGGELEGGTVLPVPAAAEQQQQRRRGGGRGKRR
jgi:BRCA1-associated protein